MAKVLIMAGLMATATAHADMTLQQRYPSPWRDDFNLPISKALAQNSVRGCGEFKYRPSSRDKGEFLVYCTRDGKSWVAYLVWAPIAKVTGPHQVSADIPP
ncbi:hypothetical protein [Delftia acidovorans]|uniref:hypothetical protein n=1 Tax=Delftia acidovorans TaxID=80866 RepID=UPI0028AA3D5E|nr:hypothetical protein [Delftia acidovorans]